ncbi:hypothetical protein NUW58_g453 [Xylaria curta]|uniref:Uncharacterized protein n=1 Tax=Xylaria curta TaxID=42375 RepID=A0ACC1PSJ5_9PEZI|nr:hypothetical protein NUW58_g453 [Xylaria curta]
MDAASATSANKKAAVKLIPKKLAVKGRWKKRLSDESFGSLASTDNEEHARGRSPSTRESEREGSRSGSLSTTQSNELANNDGVEDVEASDTTPSLGLELRPAVPSTHPSQIGHLTTSSPIIQANHLSEVQTSDQQETRESLSRSATFSGASSDQSHEIASTLSSSKTGLYPPSDSSSSRRSRSPAGRIKDAFRGKRSTSSLLGYESQNHDRQSQEILVGLDSRPSSAATAHSEIHESDFPSRGSRTRKSQPPLEISVRPHTPPSSEPTGPVIVNTPPTPTNPSPKFNNSPLTNPNVVVSPSGNMISHRRARSGSAASIGPSKLSNIISAPLTPTPENAVPPTPGAGFFSSVLSAAQNAASTLSSTITNTGINPSGNRPKSSTSKEIQSANDDRVEVESPAEELKNSSMTSKEPAVKTLGMGDLSLSQLGFQETASTTPTPTASKFSKSGTGSRARSESAPVDTETAPANSDAPPDDSSVDRPRSLYDYANTTPPTSIYEGGNSVHRTSSIRSAISKTKRRKRGSTGGTAGTGTTIGAAIAAANASVAHPTAAGSAPKLTGFAVASKKRNRDFHALFKSVPDDDYLIEDYSCALQREILAHGRLYVSEGHLCFSSNILGWVTTLVMSFDEIVSVEKRSTALVFKNGLMISTLHAKHVFASFASRDSTYDLIVDIWKLGHPTLRSSLNGVSLDETGGDKTEKIVDGERAPGSQSGSGSEEDESEDEDVYDEDLEDDDNPAETQPSELGLVETDGEKAVSRKVSGAIALNGGAVDKSDAAPTPGVADFPGPVTHGPTDCGDLETHFDVVVGDDTIAAPLGKVYNLMFGPASVTWMSKWLTNEQKCTEFQMEDKKGLTHDNKSRVCSYIKPLYASLGPKQTKCIVTETIEHIDLEKAVNVLVTTQTPDVPNGNLFSVKTKYCLFWAENNSTRVTINCTIEWTGAIEKGAKDGQGVYWKDLSTSLKSAVSSRARTTTLNGTVRGKKKKAKGRLNQASKDSLKGPVDSAPKTHDWGLAEPLHGILGPVFDILKPVMTGNVVYGLLVGLLVSTWFGFGFNSQHRGIGYGRDTAFNSYPERAVAYEEIWRREESELWDWLEERVGLHRMNEGGTPISKQVPEPRTMEQKLREECMGEREVEEAIKITEEKLDILKSVIGRKKDIPKAKSEGYSGSSTNPLAKR